MRVAIIKPNELTPDLWDRWSSIQSADPDLHSPFLTPQWTQLVGQVRKDVEIAVVEESGAVRGFFPYQRSSWNRGKPVGTRMCDVQAAIIAGDVEWTAVDLVRACRLNSWEFHQLRSCFHHFQPHATDSFEEVFLDLSQGYEQYAAERRENGSDRLRNTEKRFRQAQREVGPVQFRFDSMDAESLRLLLEWKSAQYRRTGVTDVLAFPWVQELVRQIVANPTPEFRAMLSSLYIGKKLAAAEIGLCSHGIFHGWLAAYNIELKKYSPGSILIMEIARALPQAGFFRMELGRNDLPYKQSLRSGSRQSGAGCVAIAGFEKIWSKGRKELVSLSRNPWLSTPAGVAKRIVNPLRGWLAFH